MPDIEQTAKEIVTTRPQDAQTGGFPSEATPTVAVDALESEATEVPIEIALADKYADWSDERIEQALAENRDIMARLTAELNRHEEVLTEAAQADEESLVAHAYVGDELPDTPNYDAAKRRIEKQYLQMWSLSKSTKELDVVGRLRRVAELDEEVEQARKELPKLEKKLREAQDALHNTQSVIAEASEERRNTLYDWKGVLASYENLRGGPDLSAGLGGFFVGGSIGYANNFRGRP